MFNDVVTEEDVNQYHNFIKKDIEEKIQKEEEVRGHSYADVNKMWEQLMSTYDENDPLME